MEDIPVKTRRFTLWKPAAAAAGVLLALALVFSPSARAMAQDFLNLFRVKRFAAITVNQARMTELAQNKVDIQSLISSNTEVLKDPGQPVTVDTPQAAAQLAGLTVRTPSSVPPGYSLSKIYVQGAGSIRFKADTARLQALIETLGVTDVQIPAQLNGQTVTVEKPPVVVMNYAATKNGAVPTGTSHLIIMQAHNPQISLPDGVNMAQLGEIALRVTGMSADEAHRFAQSIDWSSTMLVPVPATATSFREVSVHGVTGLLITTSGALSAPGTVKGSEPAASGSILLWAEGDMVYAITGNSHNVQLVDL
ncbi:MAG TPA: hypothetical protein VGK81_08540, partial [Anaerolineae bacterium]